MEASTRPALPDVDEKIHGIDPSVVHSSQGVTFDVRLDRVRVIHRANSPWIEIETPRGALAIWALSGEVYPEDEFGAVVEDPIELPVEAEGGDGDMTVLDGRILEVLKLRRKSPGQPGLRSFQIHETLTHEFNFKGFEKTIVEHLEAMEVTGQVKRHQRLYWTGVDDA